MDSNFDPVHRRRFIQISSIVAGGSVKLLGNDANVRLQADQSVKTNSLESCPVLRPLLTPDPEFRDVSRGDPKPHSLSGEKLIEARLTSETWRCEITADPFTEEPHTKQAATIEKPLTLADGNALDLAKLMEMGKEHEVHFLKAMQCLNIDAPLGQGLWSGVPLREVLKLCGKLNNVRRIYYWGYHNNDPKQVFKSSVSYTQCFESQPGDLPVFLAYRINGAPLSLLRGGPVRMIVPWSHGYKSIKWLTHIFLTNDPRNQDTYANGNNDPDSYLKTAAYVDSTLEGKQFKQDEPIAVTGQVISGLSGVKRVEYWIRQVDTVSAPLDGDSRELLLAPWVACEIEPQPDWATVLPKSVQRDRLLGFDPISGFPTSWPTRYGMCSYFAIIRDLKPGNYELRVRSVDLNGFAQPEPRTSQKSGRNNIQVRRFDIIG